MGLLDALIFGVRDLMADLTPQVRRSRVGFVGAVTVTDDPTNDRTLVTVTGGSSVTMGGDVSGPSSASVVGGVGGAAFGAGVAAFLTAPSSANLATALTTKTGTGKSVFDTSPTIDSPVITGAPVYQGTRTTITALFGEIQTASNAITTVASFAMSDETEACFEVDMGFARRGSVTKSGRYKRSVTYRRTGGGAPVLVGTLETGTDQQTEANTITVDVSGNSVRFRATSADSDGRNWWLDGTVKVTSAA